MLMLRTFICGEFLIMTENNDQLSVYLLKLHTSASASFYCSFVALKEVRIVNKREVRRHGDGWGVLLLTQGVPQLLNRRRQKHRQAAVQS